MMLSIKKFILSGILLSLGCSTIYAKNIIVGFEGLNVDPIEISSTSESSTTPTSKSQSFDLGNSSSNYHTCDPTTHKHEYFISHNENCDTLIGVCINLETCEPVAKEEIHVYHNDAKTTVTESPAQNTNSTTSSSDTDDWKNQHSKDWNNHHQQETEYNHKSKTYVQQNKHTIQQQKIRETLEKIKTTHDLTNKLSLPIVEKYLKQLRNDTAAKYENKKTISFRTKPLPAIAQAELKFIDLLISGEITQLLKQIEDPILSVAEEAFAKLKELWPWKRGHTFLTGSFISGTGENSFITHLGINIMKIAEKDLISRPDYIAQHADAQSLKIIQEFKEKCIALQQKGDFSALSKEELRLRHELFENAKNDAFTTNVCYAIVEKTLHHPVTLIFTAIRRAPSLEKAIAEMINLEIQIRDQAQKRNLTHNDQIKQWTIDHYGFDVLNAAQNCYASRADYIAAPEKQSLSANTMRDIINNIKHKDLPTAHAELVRLDKQVDKVFEERYLTLSTAHKEHIKKSFGKNIVSLAHKTYKARADHKQLAESFMAIDVNQAAVKILQNNTSYESVANDMNDLAQHIFGNARLCNLSCLPKIESHVYDAIDGMRTAQDHPTFIFNFSMANRTLGDIQLLAHAILSGTHPVLQRSSELLIIGFSSFFKELNPVTQVSNMGHLGSLLKKCGAALWNDPIAVMHNGITTTFTLTELIINTAHFTSDLTVGKLYLSPEEYQQRINVFCEIIEPLQDVTGDQCMHFAAQLAADTAFFWGLGTAYTFLKEIDVLEKLGKSTATVTKIFKKGFDTHLADNPIMVTAEGITIKLSDAMHNMNKSRSGNNIINSSKALFESIYTPKAIELEKTIEKIRKFYILNPEKDLINFGNRDIKIALEHILGLELKWTDLGSFLKLSGFHHDFMGAVEKSNVFQFINKIIKENGCYSATLIIDGIETKKTFFPQHWDQEAVIKKIYEAYANYIKSGTPLKLEKNGKYIVHGLTNEGITIEMHITQKGLIKTAYPIVK